MTYTISRTNKDNPDFEELIKQLDEYLQKQYGESQSRYAAFNNTDTLEGVVIAYKRQKPIGCGAFRRMSEDNIEIKRMYVNPDYRSSGVGSLILNELEGWATEDGYNSSLLETGKNQPEAIRFYRKHAYSEIPNYPPYDNMPDSICMSKELNV